MTTSGGGSRVFAQPDAAATPLSVEEARGLIPAYIAFRHELNRAEQENILRGQRWALETAAARKRDLLTEKFILDLHRRMFGDVWRWAGKYRAGDKNLGVPFWQIPVAMRQLLDDARGWLEFSSFPADEIAVRLHHRLVSVHPFPNGNGRHARLLADLLALRLGRPRFAWGRGNLRDAGALRREYIEALRAADAHDLAPLAAFARGGA